MGPPGRAFGISTGCAEAEKGASGRYEGFHLRLEYLYDDVLLEYY